MDEGFTGQQMSSIEKAIGRLIEKKRGQYNDKDFGTVEENVDEQQTPVEATVGSNANKISDDVSSRVTFSNTKASDFKEKKICHLDFRKLDESGFLTPMTRRRKLSEEYRILKRPVLMNAFSKGAAPVENGNLVVVTSAKAGEGKTYTAFNLAISMAMEMDTTVLLVDADVIKTSLSHQLGLGDEKGLMDLLNKSIGDVSEVILATDIPRLKILPAGKLPANPTELLSSKRMLELTRELASRYPDRVILFDAPPILETTEASAVIDLMGQVLVVVESSATTTDIIQAAVNQIDPQKVIGMILNKNRYAGASHYYGGYYGAEENNEALMGE